MIALLVALAIAIMPAAALASGPRTGAVYVALGDSYAAGEGLGPFQGGTDVKKGTHRNQCHRSPSRAYADLVPAVVLPTVTSRAFWACSGATISDMESAPPQRGPSEQYQQPEQTRTVGPTTRWISLSVGGDDLGFGAVGTACGGAELSHLRFQRLPGQPSCTHEIAAQSTKLGMLQSGLEGLYNQLLTAAPQAKLVVLGYPRIFPSSYKGLPVYQGKQFCILDHYPGLLTVDVGMPVSDAQAIDRFEVKLNSTIQRATMMARYPADAARIKYADTYDASVPRNCKGATPHASVAGLVLSPRFHGIGPWYKALIGSGTFHPTDDGQRMMADVVEAAFNSFPRPAPAPTANPGGGVTINTTPLPSQMLSIGPGPTNAAFDSDGTLWITRSEGLERVGSDGELSYVPIEGEQYDGSGNIVQGPEGNVWFTSLEQVGFVDDLGEATTFDYFGTDEIQAIGLPNAIAVGPNGAIWFADESNPGSISEINSYGEITRHIIPTPSASWMLKGLTSGSDGALWYTQAPFGSGESAAIGRITTDGEVSTWPLTSPDSDPFQIVSGPDGALWFTDAGTHAIGRITTGGEIVEYPIPTSVDKYGPFGLTVSNGSLWFTTATHIGQITTAGQITLWPVTGAQELSGITAASDGTLWVMDQAAGTAYHIEP